MPSSHVELRAICCQAISYLLKTRARMLPHGVDSMETVSSTNGTIGCWDYLLAGGEMRSRSKRLHKATTRLDQATTRLDQAPTRLYKVLTRVN